MTVAMDRSQRAQQSYGVILQQVKAITERMQEDSEWHQKQKELDSAAMGRAREAAKKKKKEGNVEDWLPAGYKMKGKRNPQCQDSKAKGKARR